MCYGTPDRGTRARDDSAVVLGENCCEKACVNTGGAQSCTENTGHTVDVEFDHEPLVERSAVGFGDGVNSQTSDEFASR
ncbi:hypothetical protein BaRGS_00028665, partial [Batillaria attramentaria]